MIHMQAVNLFDAALLHRVIFDGKRKVEIVVLPFARIAVLQVLSVIGAL